MVKALSLSAVFLVSCVFFLRPCPVVSLSQASTDAATTLTSPFPGSVAEATAAVAAAAANGNGAPANGAPAPAGGIIWWARKGPSTETATNSKN